MTFTAAEKLLVTEFHLKAAEPLEFEHHADLLRAIADQLGADIIDEASKVTAYLEWKDAQDGV